MVRHRVLVPAFGGSSPSSPAKSKPLILSGLLLFRSECEEPELAKMLNYCKVSLAIDFSRAIIYTLKDSGEKQTCLRVPPPQPQ